MSCTTLASHLPSLNLILDTCEVGLITHSCVTEVRKVRIGDVCSLHTWSTKVLRRAKLPLSLHTSPPGLPAPWDPHGICWNTEPEMAAPGTE